MFAYIHKIDKYKKDNYFLVNLVVFNLLKLLVQIDVQDFLKLEIYFIFQIEKKFNSIKNNYIFFI